MTRIGCGGVVIAHVSFKPRFKRDYKKLPAEFQALSDTKIKDLFKNPFPPGLKFEKLSRYSNPDIYTIHVTGNYKISMEIDGDTALLRRVGNHNLIDRKP